ncbi:hypothetical protein BaRGS_00035749, partial [Batillaria attramentaria]
FNIIISQRSDHRLSTCSKDLTDETSIDSVVPQRLSCSSCPTPQLFQLPKFNIIISQRSDHRLSTCSKDLTDETSIDSVVPQRLSCSSCP